MKEVSTIEELTIEILNQFADMFENDFSVYSYVFENGTIKINNPDMVTVLSITPNTVTVKDIIQDAIDNVLYQAALKMNEEPRQLAIDAFKLGLDSDTLRYLTNQLRYVAEPEPNFKTYKYFNTEEQWFQKSTVHDDVLPYESSLQINRIKKAVFEDLKGMWLISE